MKKDNKLAKLTALVLLVTLAALILVSSTYAKYTSSANASDTVTVAKWSIKVSDKDITKKESITFDLFKTINDTNVKSGKIIAPGTSGNFEMSVENASEVTAKYSINYTIDNTKNIPLEFSLTGTDGWTNDITTLSTTDVIKTIGSEKDTITVYWRWAFEGKNSTNFTTTQTDESDTALATADTLPTVTVTATITATQVD